MSLYSRYESVSDTDKRSYNIYHSRIAGDKTTILNHERFYLWICVVFFPLWYQNDKCFALCRKEKVWYWLWILCIHATIFERFGKILISTNVYIKGASKHFFFFFPSSAVYLRVPFLILYFLQQMKQDSVIRVLRITAGNIAEAQCDQSGCKSNPQMTKGKTASVPELQKELMCKRLAFEFLILQINVTAFSWKIYLSWMQFTCYSLL